MKKHIYIALSAVELLICMLCRLVIKRQRYQNIIIKTDNLGDNLLLIRALNKFCVHNLLVITTTEAHTLYKNLSPDINIIAINRQKYRNNIFYRLKIIKSLSSLEVQKVLLPISSIDWLSAGSIFTYVSSHTKIRYGQKKPRDIGSKLVRFFNRNAKELDIGEKKEITKMENMLRHTFPSETKNLLNLQSTANRLSSRDILIFPYTTNRPRDITKDQIELIISALNEQDYVPLVLGQVTAPYKLNAKLKFHDMTNKTSLENIVNMISNAKSVICAESGPYQLAQLFKVNTLLLAGGGHFGQFFSADRTKENYVIAARDQSCFGCDWSCKYQYSAHFPCIENLKSTDIMSGLTRVLGNKDE